MTTTFITGIPRSGTTLVCACLNTLPNCVALAEPTQVPQHGDVDRVVNEIVAFARSARTRILQDQLAPSRTVNGVIADNFFEDARDNGTIRRNLSKIMDVKISKPLTPEFRPFIKYPAIFTVLAQRLKKDYPLYAIVRHPLAALASWQSVDFPARDGRLPAAEAYAPDLRDRLNRIDNPLGRQIALPQWMFQVYRQLSREHVLTYESIVDNPSMALRPLSGSSAPVFGGLRTET